jgi:hypothetical protein
LAFPGGGETGETKGRGLVAGGRDTIEEVGEKDRGMRKGKESGRGDSEWGDVERVVLKRGDGEYGEDGRGRGRVGAGEEGGSGRPM